MKCVCDAPVRNQTSGLNMRGYWKNESGSIPIMAGLVILTLVTAVGYGIETSRSAAARANLQRASDAGALAAAQSYRELKSERAAEEMASDIVEQSAKDNVEFTELNTSLELEDDGSISVAVDVTLKSAFGMIRSQALEIQSTASLAEEFLDVHLLFDRSDSMLLAENGPDLDDMLALTKPMVIAAFGPEGDGEPEGCAFACHSTQSFEPDTRTLYDHAVENNITLRSNRIATVSQDVIAGTFRNRFASVRLGVINFSERSEIAQAPTRDQNLIADALQVGPKPHLGEATHYPEMFDFVLSELGTSGTGETQDSPKKLLVLMTDGAYTYRTSTADFEYKVIDPAHCQGVKDAGFELAVVNTRYDPIDNSGRYDALARDNTPLFGPALRACASPGLYFEVASGGDIQSVFEDLARDIVPGQIARIIK